VVTPITGLAAKNPQAVGTNAILALRQQAESEALRRQIDDLNTRINDTNGSIASINYGLVAFGIMVTVFGVMVTLVGLAAGFLAIRSAEDKAREAARKSAKEWMEDHAQDQIREMRLEFDKLKTQVNAQADDAQQKMAATALETERKGEQIQGELEYVKQAALERVQTSINAHMSAMPSQGELEILKDTEHTLKDKPENKYSFADWTKRGLAAYAEKKFEVAAEYFNEAAETRGASQSEVGRALINKAYMFRKLGRDAEAIAVYDEVIARFGNDSELALREQVARALLNKSLMLGTLGRDQDAIASCDELIARFGNDNEPALREQVARALLNKSLMLGKLGHDQDAIASCDELIARFENTAEPVLREQVARARLNKAMKGTLGRLGDNAEAIAVFDDVIARCEDESAPALREIVEKAKNARLPITEDY
jgi:tetratricopeptide (TPR) repeat protein